MGTVWRYSSTARAVALAWAMAIGGGCKGGGAASTAAAPPARLTPCARVALVAEDAATAKILPPIGKCNIGATFDPATGSHPRVPEDAFFSGLSSLGFEFVALVSSREFSFGQSLGKWSYETRLRAAVYSLGKCPTTEAESGTAKPTRCVPGEFKFAVDASAGEPSCFALAESFDDWAERTAHTVRSQAFDELATQIGSGLERERTLPTASTSPTGAASEPRPKETPK